MSACTEIQLNGQVFQKIKKNKTTKDNLMICEWVLAGVVFWCVFVVRTRSQPEVPIPHLFISFDFNCPVSSIY